jgi:hypothetical protein
MSGELMGIDLKIERAKTRLADLKKRIKLVTDLGDYRFSVEYDSKTKKHVYRVHDVPAIDPEWSIELGEVLYQLRSALDHLAWQLVLLDGGVPGEKTQFPIRDSPLDKNGKLRRLKTLLPQVKNSKILRLLNECQPYAGDGTETLSPFDAHGTPLWHLKTLNNVDKHRLLLVTVCILDVDAMWWGLAEGVKNPVCKLNMAPLKDGSPVAWFDFHGAEPPPNFNPHPSLQIVISDPGAAALSYIEAAGAIENLCWWVEWHILGMRFAPLFPEGRDQGLPTARMYPL